MSCLVANFLVPAKSRVKWRHRNEWIRQGSIFVVGTRDRRLPRAGMCIFSFGRVAAQEAAPPAPWVAPDEAKKVKNPIPPTQETLAEAEMLFTDNCVLCHGEKGLGDGPGAKTIKVKPANFTDAKLMAAETDGSLFWKMSNGRGPMPSWKLSLIHI